MIQLVLIFTGGQDANSGTNATGPVGTRLVRLFSFFTIQSNLFVLGTSIALALNLFRDGKLWRQDAKKLVAARALGRCRLRPFRHWSRGSGPGMGTASGPAMPRATGARCRSALL